METTREIALRTYKDATEHGMMDTPMNWHIWKRAFDTAERELKNMQLGAVSGRSEQLACIHNVESLRLIGGNIICLDCKSTWVRQANCH